MSEWTKESKENYDWLVKSKEQLKHGQYAEHNRTDVNGDNMDFNRLLEKQKIFAESKHKIEPQVLTSYEREFEQRLIYDSVSLEGSSLTFDEVKAILDGEK